MKKLILIIAAIAIGFGAFSTRDTWAHSAPEHGYLHASNYPLDGVAARLLGNNTSVRVQYRGPGTQTSYRVIVETLNGEEVARQDMGFTVDEDPIEIDGVVMANVLEIGDQEDPQQMLNLVMTSLSGHSTLRMRAFLDDLLPEDHNGSSKTIGLRRLEEKALGTEGLTFFEQTFSEPDLRIRAVMYVE